MPYRRALRKTNLGFVIASSLVFGIGILSYFSTRNLINDSSWVSHTLEVQANLSELSTHLLSAEDFLDEYGDTADPAQLDHYRSHLSRIFPQLENIRSLTSDNIVQQERIAELKPLIQSRLNQWAQVAKNNADYLAKNRLGSAHLEKPVAVGEDILRVIGLMQNFESKLLADRTQKSSSGAKITLTVIALGSSMAIMLIAFAAWRMNRDMMLRFEAEERSRAHAERAEKASRAQSQFLANMSHEIRTPLNGIIGMTEMVLDSSLTESQRKFVQIIQESSAGLLHIINDILDFSKVDAGKLDLEFIPFNLRDLVETQLEIVSGRLDQKNLTISYSMDSQVPTWLRGDPGRIAQVLLNLVGNAIKFTSVGSISISVLLEQIHENNVDLKFIVKDTGIGVSAETAQRLFRPFTQADDSTARKYGGTGLGLSISKKLTELMGGTIGVESLEGDGSSFWFTCHLEKFEKPSLPDPLISPSVGSLASTQKKGHILVVEDNPVNQTLVLAQLKKLGYTTYSVSNGKDALEAIAKGAYDLILMDCQMPEMDGFETTLLIRRSEVNKGIHTPIIALTANAMRDDKLRCLEVGMDEFLTKPIKLDDLAKAITRWNPVERANAV